MQLLPSRNNKAALAKAESTRETVKQRIQALQADREAILLADDSVSGVQVVDAKLSQEQSGLRVWEDRITALGRAVRDEELAQLEKEHAAAVAIVAKRIAAEVELAERVEQLVRDLGNAWEQLIRWRGRIVAKWPSSLPPPRAAEFEDLRQLRKELSAALFSAGRPTWSRQCSIPPPGPPDVVGGAGMRGLAKCVADIGAAFVARLKSARIRTPDDESEAA